MKKFEGDPDILALFTNTARAQLTKVNNALLAVEKKGVKAESLKLIRGEIHTLKGDSRMIGLESVSGAAHAVEDLITELEKAAKGERGKLVRRIFSLLDAIGAAIERLPEEVVEIDPAEITAGNAGKAEIDSTAAGASAGSGSSAHIGSSAETEPPPSPTQGRREDKTEIITLNVKRIEDLIQKSSAFPQYFNKFNYIFGQLENLRNEMEADPRPAENAKQLASIVSQFSHELSFYDLGSRQFQSEITKLKLVPLATVFDQFPRLVRDIAEHTGKAVAFTVKGKDSELDKTIVERLKTVLIHLLRNAVDHGIESPAAREKAGKPKEGRIVLHASNRGDMVEVEIGDDGAGLDLDRIRETAIERGILAREDAGALGADDTMALIFAPGFSTKEVGSFSGRGVGLDVVARTVKEMNGQVSVKSTRGRGTTFTVSFPLISSFIPITVFLLGERLFGIPSAYIKSVLRVRESDRRDVADRPVITVEGEDIALIDLNSWLGFGEEPADANKNVIIVSSRDEISACVVRDIIYEKKMIIRKTDWLVRACPVVMGAVLSGRERAIPILNVPEIFNKLKETMRGVVRKKARAPGVRDFRQKNILLVEDSAVSRTRQRDILEGQSFNVFEAAHGKDALALLEKQSFDVVITDIEMPVMNGPELIRRIRATEGLERLPVIVMSSYNDNLASLKDLGINTFVDKTKFSVKRLIEALAGEGIIKSGSGSGGRW
ncbi:MAG: response regulator [Spirochaetales bacterium]|nr:response regulator [Spirochaetales bacterium]